MRKVAEVECLPSIERHVQAQGAVHRRNERGDKENAVVRQEAGRVLPQAASGRVRSSKNPHLQQHTSLPRVERDGGHFHGRASLGEHVAALVRICGVENRAVAHGRCGAQQSKRVLCDIRDGLRPSTAHWAATTYESSTEKAVPMAGV